MAYVVSYSTFGGSGPCVPNGLLLNRLYAVKVVSGATFTSVATDILFAQDVYADYTVNVGSSAGHPIIALNSDQGNNNMISKSLICFQNYEENVRIFL